MSSKQRSEYSAVQIFLDLYFDSPMLIHQTRDIPTSKKFDTIMLPINTALGLTIDDYSGYEEGHGLLYKNIKCSRGKYAHLVSKRDLPFIVKQIMKLNEYEKVVEVAENLNLWKEKVFVRRAVEKYGFSLMYASKKLRNNREIVILALTQNGYALQYASNRFRSDRELVKLALVNAGCVLRYTPESFQCDRELVTLAIKSDPHALCDASLHFGNDRELVLLAISGDGDKMEYASKELKNDREMALLAVKNSGRAIRHLSEQLRNDKELVKQAIRTCQATDNGKFSPLEYVTDLRVRSEIEKEMEMELLGNFSELLK